MVDLAEEVGELARAVLIREGRKKPKPGERADVEDAICDVLFNLLLLADRYGVDLDKAYPAMLQRFHVRARKREL